MIDIKRLKQVYATLQQGGYNQDFDTFKKGFTGNENYANRKHVYDLLSANGAQIGNTYEEFMQNMQKPKSVGNPTVNKYRQQMFNSVDPNKSRASELTHRAVGQAVRGMNNVRKPVTAKVVNQKGKPTGEEFAITPAKTVEDLDMEYAQEVSKNWENELHNQMADADKDAAKISDMFKSFIGSTDEVGSVWGNMTRGGGIAGTPHSVTTNNGILENTEARQLLAAGDYNRKRRELLQLEQDSRNGAIFDDHSFWRGMYDAAKDTGFLTGGASDLINAGSLLATKQDLDNGVYTEAGDMLLQQAVKNSDAQSQYGDNQGWMYAGGVITTNMAPFVMQIASAGFSKGMSNAIGKVVQGAASKVALGTMKNAARFASADLAKNIGKFTGLTTKSFGKAIQYGIVGAAQANTVGLGNVANDVINRYTGQVYQDEQGNYKFGTFDSDGNLVHEGGEDFLTALVKGDAAQTIEFATELSGGGIDAVGTALKNFATKGGKKIIEKYNMENVSKVINFLLNNKVSKNARYLKAGADRTLGKVELNSIVGESLEEELGIIANTVFTGDNKISDLWDEKQQSQIWGGMLLSIGLMKGAVAPFHAYNAKQYYSYKHKLDKADVNLSQLLGKEKWEELRNQIDATTNEDMPEMVNKINRDVALGKNRQPVREYIQNLLIMRGYDIGNMLAAKKAVEDKGEGVSVKNMEKNQAYQQGRDAYGYDTHEIQLDQEDKQKSLAQLLGISEQQLASMSDDELEALSGRDDNIDRAIYDYQLSTARYEGVVDNARDQIDLEVQRAAQAVDMYTDKSRNTIRNATIKATGGLEDYGVYIINGNIATHEDGSIDISNSDDMILYYDPTTNTVEHADAMMFAELGSEENADEVRSQAMTDAKEKAIKETTGIIDGVVEVGTQFKTVDADGTEHTYEVLADNGDGTAMITIDGNVPTELVKGENVNIPVSFEELQKMKDESDQQRLQAAKAQREQMEKERAEQQMQAQTTQAENPAQESNTQSAPIEDNLDYSDIIREDGKVQMVDVSDKDGNNLFPDAKDVFYIQGNKMRTKFAYIDANGELRTQSFPTGLVKIKTRGEVSVDDYKKYRNTILAAESSAMPETSMIEDNSGVNRGEIEVETPTIEGETAAPESAETPATEQTSAVPAITLEDGTIVPMLEDGNPDFSKLTAAQTAELYDSQFGEDADSIVSGYVSDAKKALDKASNMTVKGKTFVEQKAAKDAKEKAIADAQAAYDSAIAIRDAYNERQLAKVEDTAEGRKNLIEKARRKFARLKSAVKDDAEAVAQLYKETVGTLLHRLYDVTGIDVTDTIPLTAEEYVASNLGAHTLNYEGTETSKGVKQETGLNREDFAKTQLLAADGKGTTIDALVHSLWENRPSNLDSLDTQDIRNAMLGVITSGFKASEARNYIENLRIAQAENFLDEQKKAADNAAFAEENKAEAEQQTETAPESEEKTGEENSDEINDEENEKINEQTNENINAPEVPEVPEDATEENPLGLQLSEDKVPFEIEGEKSGETYDITDNEDRQRLINDNKVDDKDILDIDMPKHVHKAIKELCKKMGLKVQFLYMGARSNGWIENGTMYLALDTEKATQFVFGHEMTHAIKQKNPEAYKELVNVAMAVTTKKKFEEDLAKVYQNYHGISGYNNVDDYVEEVVADNLGKFINNFDLAQKFSLRLNHPVLATILHAIQKIKSLLYGDFYKSVDALERIVEKAYVDTANGQVTNSETGEDVSFSLRQKPEPKKKGIGYKVFVLKNGKLYPPMVANPNGAETPVGVWLDADAAPIAGESKTGRPQVKQGGKGTQGGSGKLAYRPGWHLGVVPYAIQFNRKDADGNKTLFPKNFVFAEVEYAADVDYQEEAHQEGINPSGKYQHSLAGLKHLPTDGYYMYRTNPNPETDPWVITGAMKVNRILTRAEQAELVKNAGREPQQIQEGDIVTDDVVNSINQEIADAPKFSLKVYHGSGADFTEFDFDHMGEGEGSQAFGWGGYVTNSKEIGKDYTRRAKSRKANHAHFYANMGSLIANDWYEYFVKTANSESLEDAKEFVLKDLDIEIKVDENKLNRNEIPESKRANIVANLKEEKRIREIIANTKKEDLPNIASANLYEVDIPEDNGSNYLDWDAPIADELIDKVAKALPSLRSYDIKDLKKDRTFDNFYKTISMRSVTDDATFNDDKAASKLLSSLGYTGIKYKAGRNFGGAEVGDTNYVIFKPEDMKITEHTKFSLKLKPVRFEAGKKLSDEEKKEVLSTLKDSYKVNGVPYHIEETAGGKEKRVYEPTADSYVVSDITNRPLRYYITLPDGRVAHPTEVYPNISDNEVKSSATKQGLLDDEADQIVSAAIGNMKDIADNAKAVEVLTELQNLPHETHDVGYGMNNAQSYNYKTGIFTSDAAQAIDYVVRRMRRKEDVPTEIPAALKKAVADSYGMVDNLIDGMSSTKFSLKDNQGNPLNQDGTLKLDKIKSVDELTDEDFTSAFRNVELPAIPKNVDAAIGANGKPVVIKKNIFEKNWNAHKFTPAESKKVLNDALYNTDLVGHTQPTKKPNHWVAIKLDDKSPITVLEVNDNKDNVEVVGWYTLDERNLGRIKRQAERNGGELIMLTPKDDKVESLSTPPLSSAAKIDNSSETTKENGEKFSLKDEKIKSVAEKFGVNEDDVAMYANAVEKGSTAEAARARANIKRYLLQVNEGNIFSFKDLVKYTVPVNNALKENFGDLDAMIEERVKQVEAQRNAMEAARKRAEEEEAKRQKHLEELSLIPDDQLDKQYMDALAKGDDATAREMLDEAARRKGYDDTESSYQGVGAWAAPGNPGYESDKARRDDWESSGSDVNLEDMAMGYTPQPDDYFSHPERYSQNTPHGLESVKAINTAIDAIKNGEKDVKVKVYRAVPTSVKEGKLRNGDWVTPSKKYAEMHGDHRLEGKYRIIEDEVPANQLWWDGNDANEFGFDDGKEYRYKNAKNNRKLNDLITYDNKGNVIPPSKRFNSRKNDIRFSLAGESGAADMAEDLKSLNTPDEVDDAIKTAIEDMPSGWKMANKKMIHVAQALGENRKAEIAGEEPKFSLKNGTLIKAGTYFSGGGLVEEGLKGIIDPVLAVEYDEKISGVYRNNFGQHIVTADVRDVDPRELVKQIDGEVEYFHASPVCKNYSQAKSNHAEVELDKETAASTADFINAVKPKVVTIENVKGYKDSDAMKVITDALDANGYTWDADVYNAADYGGYTNRERLIVRAVRDGKLPEKPKKMAHKSGWYEAVADIIPTLTEKKNGVAPWMDVRLKADGIDWRNIDKPLYVMGSAYADGKVPHAFADELLPTLRTKSGDVIVMPDGKVYRAMGRVLARVSGVSDDYKMPFSENLSHTIIGNGIPTQLTEHVIAPLLTGSDPKFSIRTYHGTGASFDKFDFSHMGEGEGSQAFGWGGYVTNSKEIAEDYTRRAKIRKNNGGFEFVADLSDSNKDMVKQYIYKYKDVDKGLDAMRKDLPDALELFPDDENIKELSKVLEKKNEEIAVPDNIAYLYDVDVPDDNGDYLYWENKLKKSHLNKVNKELARIGKEPIETIYPSRVDGKVRGEDLYDELTSILGSKEAASKLLSDAGFVGIKYPAGTIYGGAKEGDYNYVIFDENNANIVGNTKFSLRGSTPYDKQMEEWKEKNHLDKDAAPMEKPVMQEGENIFDYANRMVEWTRNQNLWKTAPKQTGFQDALDKWKADNGLSPDAYPPVRPHREYYSSEIGYAEDLEEYNKKKELWKSAPKPKDFDLSVDLEDMNKQLRNIRRAVLNQKNYDQRTVKAVSDLVRKMLNIGWGDGLSRGKVGNLLSAAKNATGANDVKKHLDKAMGILAENYLNRLSTAYDNLINTKGARADQSGVIKMGSLDAKGQAFMSEYKKAINMDDKSLNTYIANIEEDSAKNEDNVEMNDYRLAGIQAAIIFKQQIGGNDADIAELQRQIGELKNKKDATKEDKDLLKSLEKKLFENKFDRITMYENLLNNIQRMVKESKGRAKEFREEIAEHKNEILHRANLDLEGVDSTYYDTTTAKKKLVNNDLQRAVFSSTYTFEQFLKFFGKKAANGEGYLYNYFTKLNQDALDEEQLYNEMNRNALDEKTKELFGKKKFMKLVGIAGKGMKEMDIEVTDYSNKKTGKRTIHLKQGQMLYIYLVNKETDGEMKLRAMGITEEDVAAIEENLDPRVKAMGEWLQDEYLPECQRRYQATHTKYFGAPMKEVENYFPLAINNRARNVKEDVNQDSDAMSQLAGTSTGAIVTRRVNVIPLDIENADAFEVAFNHLQEMEEWSAMLPFRQDVNTLLSYTHFRNQVQNMSSVAYGSGKTLWDEFKQTAQIAAGTYKPKVNAGMMDSRIAAAMGGIAVAKISGRLWTAIKQSQSATVFLPECDFTRFVKNGVNPYGSWKWAMENIPDFRKRVENMTYGDVKLRQYLDELEKWHDWTKVVSKWGMKANILVDAVTCAVGARSVYETEVNRLTKLGYPKEKAEEKAYYKAVAAYNKTQQSSGGMYLSPMQVDRTYVSAALSLFKNANYAYGRMQIEACRGLARTYDLWGGKHKTALIESMTRQIMEEDGLDENTARAIAKATYNRTFRQSIGRLINFATLVPISWALYKVLPYLLTGDDDDKKTDMIEEAVLKGFATSLSDNYVIPFASNILNAGLKVEDGKPTFDPEIFRYQNLYINPATSDLANIYSMVGNQKWYSVANKLGMLGVQSLIGFNPETVGALYQALSEADYDNGNTAKEWQIGILKAISAPEESIRELYMDELGLKSGDINKIPLAELEKRYAERQINRDNLLSQIGMDAETFNGYVDKYQKSFEKKIKDKMDKWDEYDKKKTDAFFDTTSDPKLKDMIAKKRTKDANAAADEQIAKEGLNQEKNGKESSEEAYDAVKMSIDVAEDNAISTYNKVLNKRYAALNEEYNNQSDAMKYIFMSNHPNFKAYKDIESEYTNYGKKMKELKEKLVSAKGYDAKQTILKQIRAEREKFDKLQSNVK